MRAPDSASHDGDTQFCSTHLCIANFANGNGTVVQCADGDWSHSGGLSGACSDHGGESGTSGASPPPTPPSAQVPSPAPTPSPGPSEGLGSFSHSGDAQFCATHACIANFPNGNGTVVQCTDGEWSHSGGLSGACSDHGGEATPGSTPNIQTQTVPPSTNGSGAQSLDAVTSDGAVVVTSGSIYSVDGADQSTVSAWSSGDPLSVSPAGDRIANTSTGDTASVTYVGSSSNAAVYSNTGDHTQATNSDDGSIVVLDDGSIWEVKAPDQSTSSGWADGSSVTVNEHPGGTNYTLVNTDDQSSVQADYIGDE